MSEERKPRRRGGMMSGPKLSKADMEKRLKEMAPSMKKHFVWMLFAALFLLGSVLLSIFAPQELKSLTNEIAEHFATKDIDLGIIQKYAFILMAMYGGNAVLSYLASFIMTTVSQRYSQELRRQIMVKINKMPLSYFDKHQYGDVLSILTNDVDTIGQSLENSISMLIQSAFMLTGTLIAMFATSWQMALAALISLPLMIVILTLIMKVAMPQFKKRQELLGDLEGTVEENYSGQLIIKAFGAEERMNRVFEEKNGKLSKTLFLSEFYGGLMMPMMNFISYFAYAAVCVTGGLLLVNGVGGISYGTITAFLVYVQLFQSPLSQISQAINSLQSGLAASGRVFAFLGEEEITKEDDKKFIFLDEQGHEEVKGQIEFKNVGFSYEPTRKIIHDFSASIKPGSKIAIVGPTGAGKTTMVNLLMRFYEAQEGDISIDGVSIKNMKREEIHDIFGMVLQDTWVFNGTIRENLAYNTPQVSDEQINEVLKKVDLDHYISTLPNGLDYVITDGASISAGERQLLTIARAMIRKAPLLILDEATSNVDTRTEERIQKAMDALTEGRTSFIIAHRLSTIRNADLILVMKDGGIVEQGNHDELMKFNGFYASLYNSQFAFE